MYPTHTDIFINHEQQQSRLREIEHQQLLKIAAQQHSGKKVYQQIIHWLGIQLVRWGTKLQEVHPQILTQDVKKHRLKYL